MIALKKWCSIEDSIWLLFSIKVDTWWCAQTEINWMADAASDVFSKCRSSNRLPVYWYFIFPVFNSKTTTTTAKSIWSTQMNMNKYINVCVIFFSSISTFSMFLWSSRRVNLQKRVVLKAKVIWHLNTVISRMFLAYVLNRNCNIEIDVNDIERAGVSAIWQLTI